MKVANRIAVCALMLVLAAIQAFAANVFALPSNVFESNIPVYLADPFQAAGTLTTTPGVIAILPKLNGSKVYVVTASTTNTVVVMDSSLSSVLRSFNLSQAAKAAAISPDGRRLLVLADTLHIFDLTTANDDEIVPNPIPDVGLNPSDLAISFDSKRAYILSDDSDRLTMFDLNTNFMTGNPLTVTGVLTGVALGPNGLLYVSGTNRFYEIDAVTGVMRGEIGLNALPTKPVFTPDGQYAVLLNRTPVTGSLALLVDLKTRSVAATIPSTGLNAGITLDHLAVADYGRLFAVATNTQRLVRINISPFQLQTIGFTFDTLLGVMAAQVSNELPTPKHLFVATANTIYRGVLAATQSSNLPLAVQPSRLLFAGVPSTAAPASYRKFNDDQNVLGGATTLPLVLQAWDASGAASFNRSVQFSTTTVGVTIETAATTTNVDGIAATRITVPSTPGVIIVTANVNGLSTPVDFQVTVAGGGGGGGGGGGAGVSILSGDGQVAPRGFPAAVPLRVIVKDALGQPIIGGTVNWTLAGQGLLSAPGSTGTAASSLTDIDGVAEMSYVAPAFIFFTTSWVQSTVSATAAGLNTVSFTVTAVPNLQSGNPAIPTIVLNKPPQENRTLVGQAGQKLTGAVEFQVNAIAGFLSGQGIPGVGVEFVEPADPLTTPSAMCASTSSLSDATGLGKCDVVFGGVAGTSLATIRIGGIREFIVTVQVTPGAPGLVQIIGGNNQSGNPGQALPVNLQAEISDGFGHLLAGVPVTWEVVAPGAVSLSNQSTVSDSSGRASARATLGGTPGQVQVRLRAGTAQAIFNLFVNVAIATLNKISGDGQNAIVGAAFAQPLVVEVKDDQGALVQGALVSFAVTSGPAAVGTAAATTDAQGRASTTVTAGSSAGAVVITASLGGLSQVFNLTVFPPGPVVTLAGIRSAISGDLGVGPGSVVAIYGDGLAAGIQGSVVGNNLVGPLPLTLAGVEVLFGTTSAPIYSVNNVNGQQFLVVQAPFSLAAPGVTTVTVKVGGGSTVINNVQVKPQQPGIFETGPIGERFAVLLRPDGSYVSLTNKARKGERIRMYLSGLGQTTPALGTNFAGIPAQTVLAQIIAGINYAGVPVVSAETMVGVVGVYVVTIDVPANAPSGTNVPLNLGVLQPGGNPTIFGNTSIIYIE